MVGMGTVGGVAGLLGSLAGMGGGFVAIPMMTRLGLTQHTAHGTSLVGVFATGFAGAAAYAAADDVDWTATAAIAAGGALTARYGAAAAVRLDSRTLARALGIFMVAVAPVVPLKDRIFWVWVGGGGGGDLGEKQSEARQGGAEAKNFASGTSPPPPPPQEGRGFAQYAALGTIGLGAGFLAGLFGVGGGAVVVPLLAIGSDLDHKKALGTSLAAMVPTALAGVAAHAGHGNVNPRLAAPLALGTCCGAYLGGRAATHIPDEPMKLGFGALMLVLGTRTLLKTR